MRWNLKLSIRWSFALLLAAISASGAERYFGEPVELKGRHIYFTSWKYVRQGNFTWKVQTDANATEDQQNAGAWLKGDGQRPAVFETSDMPRGIRLVAQPAEKVPFKPGQMAATVFEDGKYKTWYTIGPSADSEPSSSKARMFPGYNVYVAYAESANAVDWTHPNLGLFDYAGNRSNSIVWRGDLDGMARGFHGGCVFVDPSSKDERYKMFHLGLITDAEWAAFEKKYPGEADTMARRPDTGGFRLVVGMFGAVSPDGIHWKTLPEPLMIQHADTINTCYYDADRKLYIAYVRAWQVDERVAAGQAPDATSWIGVGRRSIGRSVSPDFRHFSKPEIVATTGADMPPSHVFYTNGKTTLPGCPDNHVMFPWIWELENDGGSTWLLSSMDGWTWSRVPGGPVIGPGKWGEPDGAFVLASGELLEYPGDKWAIGYSGSPIPHKYPGRDLSQRKGLFPGVAGVAGLATWPKGRLVALQADGEGEFATVCVVLRGDRLRVNADVAPTGFLKLAVRQWGEGGDIAGRSFAESDRIIGNSLAAPLTWNGAETIGHQGKAVSIRVQMKQAKLFGFEFY